MYVVVTGASRGIGKAIAYKFAKCGYDLIITCEKNKEMLSAVKDDIEKNYGRKVFTKVGLLTEKDLDNFEAEANTDIKNNVYILVNNAGKCDYNTIDKVDENKYKNLISSNIDYTFFTTKLISKYLLRRKSGVIVNITSMLGILGFSCEVVYSMAKGAIISFTKALAREMYESNVDSIAFALGAVDTDMVNNFLAEDYRKEFLETLDGGRLLDPSEVAEKIYKVVSERSYTTGDIIEINNGLK